MRKDGSIYEGNWVNGKLTGKGRLIKTNGDIYVGDFLNTIPEGIGYSITIDDWLRYDGPWTNGLKHG